jgi:hypothetical protein
MKRAILITSVFSWLVIAGCGASEPTPVITTVTTTPKVDVALQGTWAGTGGAIIGGDATVAITINNGTINITTDELLEREVITAQYNVQSVDQATFVLTLSQVSVDIEHYGNDSDANVNQRAEEHAGKYTDSLSKVTINLQNSDQIQFYPGENVVDAITLYRQ